jgi:hypothetical protein
MERSSQDDPLQEPVDGEESAYKRLATYAASHRREGKEKGTEVTWVTPPLKEVTRVERNLASRSA